MRIADIIDFLEAHFPPAYAEDFDNAGLLTGSDDWEAKGVLVCHDVSEAVVEEAVKKDLNLIIAFHPVIFHGLKSLTGKDYVEKTVIKAIRNDIAIYSPHTAIDNHFQGVSYWTAQALGLKNIRVLMPKPGTVMQLVTYVPHESAEQVRAALFNAGAGRIGDYEECSYNLEGYGTFKPLENANPYVGEKGKRHTEPETRISVIFPQHLTGKVIKAMYDAHPYEEPAYEIIRLENQNPEIGLGSIGEFDQPISETAFLEKIKKILGTPFLKHSPLTGKPVKKVATIGGSGASGIHAALHAGADAYVTGDLKYHDYFLPGNQMLLVDAGHFETERFVVPELVELISKKFPKFAVAKSDMDTNPVKYF